MSVDVFTKTQALKLLNNKQLWFFGDSNTRSIYKDLVWLLEHGNIVPQGSLKTKNELTHANDFKTSNAPLTCGRHYKETREYYNEGTVVTFTFLTKIFSDNLLSAFEGGKPQPDVVVINSCVWDLTRWGPNGVGEYKRNIVHTMEYLKKQVSRKCLVIFTTTLPLSSHSNGGFLTKEVECLRYEVPWHVIEANYFLAEMAKLYKFDVLDLHYYMRFLREEWMPDGIHWSPIAYRLITNTLLTHVALSFNAPLPQQYNLDCRLIEYSQLAETNSGEKRKAMEVPDSNEAKKIRSNLVLNSENNNNALSDLKGFIVIDECDDSTVTVADKENNNNQNEGAVETKAVSTTECNSETKYKCMDKTITEDKTNDLIEVKSEQQDIQQPDLNLMQSNFKDETGSKHEIQMPLNESAVKTNNQSNISPNYSTKDRFTFAFIIGNFSPQLEQLK